MPIRIVNTFAAALFLVMAPVSALFLGAGRDGFAGAPARPWTAAGWAALFALLALLAFVNLRRAGFALNAAAALPMLVGLAIADPADRPLFGACALPFTLTALLLARKRRDQA
jgi:hypothetical protein